MKSWIIIASKDHPVRAHVYQRQAALGRPLPLWDLVDPGRGFQADCPGNAGGGAVPAI